MRPCGDSGTQSVVRSGCKLEEISVWMVDPVRPLTPHMEKPSSLLKGSFTHKELLMMRENPEVPFLKNCPPLSCRFCGRSTGERSTSDTTPACPGVCPCGGFQGCVHRLQQVLGGMCDVCSHAGVLFRVSRHPSAGFGKTSFLPLRDSRKWCPHKPAPRSCTFWAPEDSATQYPKKRSHGRALTPYRAGEADLLTETCGVAPTGNGCGLMYTPVSMKGVWV